MTHFTNLRRAAIVAGVALLAACSSSSTSTGSGPTTTAAASTTTAATTPETVAATTIPPTTVPAPIVFTLRSDGLGPFNLGVPASELLDALSLPFGAPSSDEATEYPVADGFGAFTTADGEFGFAFPFGRSVCWAFGLCVLFGGADAVAQTFTGWYYNDSTTVALYTPSGVTIGSVWSDFPTMTVYPGGCYTVGSGEIDGVALTLQSDVVAFGSFDDLGNYIETVPPADQVRVTYMQTGQIPAFLFGDC